jgi:hypothetical protein
MRFASTRASKMVASAEGHIRYCGRGKATRAENTRVNPTGIPIVEREHLLTALEDNVWGSKVTSSDLGYPLKKK